jgi:hypothetical protein
VILLAVVLAATSVDGGVEAPPPPKSYAPDWNHPCLSTPLMDHGHCDPFIWLLFSAGVQFHPQGDGIETSAVLDLEVQFRRHGHVFTGWGPQLDLGIRHQAQWLFEPGVGASWNPDMLLEVVGSVGPSIGFDGRTWAGRVKLTVWFFHLLGVDLALQVTPHGDVVPMAGFRVDPSFPLLTFLTPSKFSAAWWVLDEPETARHDVKAP